MRAARLAAFAGVAAAGCARANRPAGRTAAEVVDSVRGRVAVTGSEPLSSVVLIGQGRRLVLTGPLTEELARASGAVATVWGQPVPPPPERFLVAGYRVDSVEGAPTRTGVVRAAPGGEIWLIGTDSVRLAGPSELRSLAGARVWVTGPSNDGSVAVSSYGVLRDPKE